jgi:hypothetical protein
MVRGKFKEKTLPWEKPRQGQGWECIRFGIRTFMTEGLYVP